MLKQVTMHYPTDESMKKQINKELINFRLTAVIKYIETLQLNDAQTKALFDSLAKDVSHKPI